MSCCPVCSTLSLHNGLPTTSIYEVLPFALLKVERFLPTAQKEQAVALLCYDGGVPLILGGAMSTTTIRLPENLKARVAAAAKRAGTTTHGFILQAIAEKAEQEDMRAAFDADAEDRYARIVATGKTIPWQEMRGYLEERLAGKEVNHPVARKLAR